LIRHHPEFYPLYFAIVAIGAIPAVLAYPNPRLHPDKFREGLSGMSRVSGLDWILTESALHELVAPLVGGPDSTIRGVIFPLDTLSKALETPPRRYQSFKTRLVGSPDDPALLQHSSGTTGLQKGVMLSHRAILNHVDTYAEAINLTESDRVVSWLPLYHDMGLIAAFHLPLALGVPTVLIDPFEWVAAPELFLQACSRERGTVAWLPNFAYSLMAARVHDDDMAGLSLEKLRLLVNCSEPVRAESLDVFAARFRVCGLPRDSLAACYAMAEATFAVTQTSPGVEPVMVWASREALSAGHFAPARNEQSSRACVSSGRPIPGCAIRIVDENGLDLAEGTVGEVIIQSESLFSGYRNDSATTAKSFRGDWFLTGDYGFALAGELFVVGRKKDLIIVAGKNVYPEDIENAIHDLPGLLPGRVVAFGIDDPVTGTERVCVVAETTDSDPVSQRAIRRAVVAEAMRIDVTVSEVILVEPRWLIKSSAGKPSRGANKTRAEALRAGVRK
jgi:acyl-CoA synthetase (AMP-forming)/AMP-acid ligase II